MCLDVLGHLGIFVDILWHFRRKITVLNKFHCAFICKSSFFSQMIAQNRRSRFSGTVKKFIDSKSLRRRQCYVWTCPVITVNNKKLKEKKRRRLTAKLRRMIRVTRLLFQKKKKMQFLINTCRLDLLESFSLTQETFAFQLLLLSKVQIRRKTDRKAENSANNQEIWRKTKQWRNFTKIEEILK